MNFHKNASKQQRSIDKLYIAHFIEKNFFIFLFVPFYWFDQKKLFKQIQIFPQDLLLFKLVKKNKLSEYFSAPF